MTLMGKIKDFFRNTLTIILIIKCKKTVNPFTINILKLAVRRYILNYTSDRIF